MSSDFITPEEIYQQRRFFVKAGSWFAALAGASILFKPKLIWAAMTSNVKVNPDYKVEDKDRPLTKESIATSYNNFYEFSLEKNEVKPLAEKWKVPSSWKVEITGLVEKPKTYTLEELIEMAGGLEERVYRFRCVEAWSMVVPWTGFPLAKLIEKLKPKGKCKYVKFTSLADSQVMPNIKRLASYPWPYTEGLLLSEAQHPLTLMATGLYGKSLPQQNGAPFRLVVPWKYGFKSIKSVVKIEFVETQPKTLWNDLAPNEYGFFANVNPEVDHPRWSQATERILDGKLFPTRVKTLKFNGYEKEVASLYTGMDLKKNF